MKIDNFLNTEEKKNKLLYALTSFYLVFPTIFFAYGWFRWPYNFITILLIFFILFLTMKDIYQNAQFLRKNWLKHSSISKTITWIIPAFLALIAWVSFSGVGGLGFQNMDYEIRNILFRGLITQDWPLTAAINGVSTNFVYYFGYYLPAAAIGKMFGWVEANIFIALWSFFGVLLAFVWFSAISQIFLKKNAYKLLFLALVFCLAGGLDHIGIYITKDIPFSLTNFVENWIGFQYSSNATLLYWVPLHAIPAWLLTGMVVTNIYKMQNIKYVGVSIAASIIWSPFAVAGISPYLIILAFICLLPQNRQHILNPKALFFNGVALWTGVIYLLYITSNTFSFPSGFVWNFVESKRLLAIMLLQFWALEFGLLTILVLSYFTVKFFLCSSKATQKATPLWKRWRSFLLKNFNMELPQFGLFLFTIFLLIIISFYKMGHYNDFVMRGSIPALFFFWAFLGKVVIDSNIKKTFRWKFDFLYPLITITLMIGFLTGLSVVAIGVRNYNFGPPCFDCVPDISTEKGAEVTYQGAGDNNSLFYRYIGK